MSLGIKDQEILSNKKGWVQSTPLNHYSSLHELSLAGLLGYPLKWPNKHFFLELSFNLHTALEIHPQAFLVLDTKDESLPPSFSSCCFSITDFKRWRLNILPYSSFEDYLASLIRWHRCNYTKSEKIFKNYGCKVSLIEGDWTSHVDKVYQLYCNVARRYDDKLYDLHYFQIAAKRKDYKLICAWFEDQMIGMFLLQEESPTLHSICCGFDYNHSTKSFAYSWLHYELIRHAIEQQKYQAVDVGLTADESKKTIGFEAIPARMDVYTKGIVTHRLLSMISRFISARITPDSKLKFGLSKPRKSLH